MVTWWQTAENLHWPDDEYVSFFFASKIHNYYNCAIILLPCCWHWMIRMDTHFYFLSSVELMNILLCSLTLVLQTPEIELDLICGMTVLFARLDAELYARSKYHHLPRALLCLTQLQYHPTFFDHWRCKSSCVWHSFTFLIWIWMSQLLRILILLKSDFKKMCTMHFKYRILFRKTFHLKGIKWVIFPLGWRHHDPSPFMTPSGRKKDVTKTDDLLRLDGVKMVKYGYRQCYINGMSMSRGVKIHVWVEEATKWGDGCCEVDEVVVMEGHAILGHGSCLKKVGGSMDFHPESNFQGWSGAYSIQVRIKQFSVLLNQVIYNLTKQSISYHFMDLLVVILVIPIYLRHIHHVVRVGWSSWRVQTLR